MLGLSYSSMLIALDMRLSIPGRERDVNNPCPWQNSSKLCDTFAGCKIYKNSYFYCRKTIRFHMYMNLTASVKTSPALSTFKMVTLSLSWSRYNFSTTLAYGERAPVTRRVSSWQPFNDKSLRLKIQKNILKKMLQFKFSKIKKITYLRNALTYNFKLWLLSVPRRRERKSCNTLSLSVSVSWMICWNKI